MEKIFLLSCIYDVEAGLQKGVGIDIKICIIYDLGSEMGIAGSKVNVLFSIIHSSYFSLNANPVFIFKYLNYDALCYYIYDVCKYCHSVVCNV